MADLWHSGSSLPAAVTICMGSWVQLDQTLMEPTSGVMVNQSWCMFLFKTIWDSYVQKKFVLQLLQVPKDSTVQFCPQVMVLLGTQRDMKGDLVTHHTFQDGSSCWQQEELFDKSNITGSDSWSMGTFFLGLPWDGEWAGHCCIHQWSRSGKRHHTVHPWYAFRDISIHNIFSFIPDWSRYRGHSFVVFRMFSLFFLLVHLIKTFLQDTLGVHLSLLHSTDIKLTMQELVEAFWWIISPSGTKLWVQQKSWVFTR